ncbi:MAG: 3-hydroxyacyl-CoA dehydrogenase NAD-binding domain-containing protein [Pseudomonadota bacterium]
MVKEYRDGLVVLGAGSIGLAFAAVFEDAGFAVTIVEPVAERRAALAKALQAQRSAIALAALSFGKNGPIASVAGLADAPKDPVLVIECGPEHLETKRAIFRDLLAMMDPATPLATASSAIPMSRILPDAADQTRCLVAHPVNPPSVLRLIELAPAPGTAPEFTDRAAEVFSAAGFTAVALRKEVEGFVLNRLQGAVLREAYRLVEEGVADVAGIDAVMRLGLGPRWALSGPFETAELNTPGGIEAHARRMGPAYKRIGEDRGETVDWNAALVARVAAERARLLAPERQDERRVWRARAVARLVAERNRIQSGPGQRRSDQPGSDQRGSDQRGSDD